MKNAPCIGFGWIPSPWQSTRCATGTSWFSCKLPGIRRHRIGDSRASTSRECPVVSVSWFEAQKYCQWLAGMTGRHYRLPTEAEWERAARAGVEGALYPWGDEPPQARPEYQERWDGEVKGPLPVGRTAPNPYGLYDLCENVHEWCADWYHADYYAQSPERNPPGPPAGERRASRGGSWRHHVKVSRVAGRSSIPPTFQYADYGFRVARDG